jgi:stress-induced morphogen
MAIEQSQLEKILRTNFPNAQIKVVDLVGDQDHYSVEIKDAIFASKSRVEQHKIVNNVLKEELKGVLHAMQLKTSAL